MVVHRHVLVDAHCPPAAVDAREQPRLRVMSRRFGLGVRPRIDYGGSLRLTCRSWVTPVALYSCSSDGGVPDRRAHSDPSGPLGIQISRNSANAATPPSAAPAAGGARANRRHSHDHGREHEPQAGDADASNQVLFTSLPVPKPCSSAIGQLA